MASSINWHFPQSNVTFIFYLSFSTSMLLPHRWLASRRPIATRHRHLAILIGRLRRQMAPLHLHAAGGGRRLRLRPLAAARLVQIGLAADSHLTLQRCHPVGKLRATFRLDQELGSAGFQAGDAQHVLALRVIAGHADGAAAHVHAGGQRLVQRRVRRCHWALKHRKWSGFRRLWEQCCRLVQKLLDAEKNLFQRCLWI